MLTLMDIQAEGGFIPDPCKSVRANIKCTDTFGFMVKYSGTLPLAFKVGGGRGVHFRYSVESRTFQGKPDCFFRRMQIPREGSGAGIPRCTGHMEPHTVRKHRVIRSESMLKKVA